MNPVDDNLFEQTLACLAIADPYAKASSVQALYRRWCNNELDTASRQEPVAVPQPGRPERPRLVSPRKVPKRGFNSPQARLRLAHAIAHIEFNAINLALDAVYRFREMPDDFYSDWLRVAAEESSHFLMLAVYLKDRGSHYGEFDAHNGLWEMAVKTDHDVMVRMALVPRVLEARGLDVTPGMIMKLRAAGAHQLVDILEIIHKEEIGHVLIGTRWFYYVCQLRGLQPREVFTDLLDDYMKGGIQGPFDHESRLQAGFSEDELQDLVRMSDRKEAIA